MGADQWRHTGTITRRPTVTMTLHDINVLEVDEDVDELEYFTAVQRAINSGLAWRFQGSYGRTMMEALKAGYCMLGRHAAQDYYGNYIPNRSEIKAGTFGSREFVVAACGEDWALAMEAAS